MNDTTKANYAPVMVIIDGIMEDLHVASPTAALYSMNYMASMAIQFSMGARVDDFIFKTHGEEARDKKREDMANLLGYLMRWMPQQAMEDLIEPAFVYMNSRGFSEQLIPEDRLAALEATGMDVEEIRLTMVAKNAQRRNLHVKQKNTLEASLAEIKAEGSRVITAALQGEPTLTRCEPWVSTQMLAKIDMALYGNGKTGFGHTGYLFDQVWLKGNMSCTPELADINNMGFKDRIAKGNHEHDEIERQWMFEVSRKMEERGGIGDDEHAEYDPSKYEE